MGEADASRRVLRDVLVLLSGLPQPQEVVAALADGPLASLAPRRTALWVVGGAGLVRVATEPASGHPAAASRNRVLSRRSHRPAATAIRAGEMVIAPDPGRVDGVRVRVPIRWNGQVVGAYGADGFGPGGRWEPTPERVVLLDAVADALAGWLTNPRVTGMRARAGGGGALLTLRQVRILELVAAGRTNEAIAAAIGRSTSTVKADLRYAMDALGATDRRQAAARASSAGLIAAGRR